MDFFVARKGRTVIKLVIAFTIVFQMNMTPIASSGFAKELENEPKEEKKVSDLSADNREEDKNEESLKRMESLTEGIGYLNVSLIGEAMEAFFKTIPKPEPTIKEEPKAKRNWSFKYKKAVTWGNRSTNAVALTFDDGVDKKSIERTLKALKKENARCTFFVTGVNLSTYAGLWRQAVEEGHQVCNHTQNHKMLEGLSNDKAIQEIRGWEKTAGEVLGQEYLTRMKQDFPFVRLPGGSGNSSSRIIKIVSDLKYIPVGWSAETLHSVISRYDKKKNSADTIAKSVANHVVGSAQNGAIILLHFDSYNTLKLEYILKTIKERGKEIRPVSEILE
ncbi:MAG: polysaccharide deacetylase family protein [Clostridia bacterium]|nr:polysaccharide deacetylase family protein [Clostridia bacterium]